MSSPEFWFTIVALQDIVSSAQGQSWSKIITSVRWYCSIWIIISDLKKSWAGRVLMFNYKSKQMKLSLKEEGRRQFLRRLRLWILAVEKLMLNCTAGSKRWNYTNHVWMMWKIVLLCFIIYHFFKIYYKFALPAWICTEKQPKVYEELWRWESQLLSMGLKSCRNLNVYRVSDFLSN